ncbi:hypothetical protein BVY02_02675 [bacterium J17]|nr:hypothetical protein BVY02_02675 [bacterium J17]
MSLLRSLLFVPANQSKMLSKISTLTADAFIPDLEDSVPDAEKENARKFLAEHLDGLLEQEAEFYPRVNSLPTGLTAAEIDSLLRPGLKGITIGKVSCEEDVAEIDKLITAKEKSLGLDPLAFRLIVWIETAKGIVNAYEICKASKRLVGVAFGAEDFAADMAIERSDSETELVFARSTIAVAARAASILALDTPHFTLKDPEGLKANCLNSKRMGFKGRFAIHPEQIPTIEEAYSPSEREIENAKRVVAAFEEAERQGKGATSLDDKVIDIPVVNRAKALLSFAESN